MVARLPLLLGAPCPRGATWAEGDGQPASLGLAAGSRQGARSVCPCTRPGSRQLVYSCSRALGQTGGPQAALSSESSMRPREPEGSARSTEAQAGGDPSHGTYRPSRPQLRPLSAALGTGLGVSPGCGRGLALAGLSPGLGVGGWGVLRVLLPWAGVGTGVCVPSCRAWPCRWTDRSPCQGPAPGGAGVSRPARAAPLRRARPAAGARPV